MPEWPLGCCLGLALCLALHPTPTARAVPDSVKVACSSDYNRFCPRYKVGTGKLNRCMRSNGKRLSRVCVRALIDNGMVPAQPPEKGASAPISSVGIMAVANSLSSTQLAR